jgi:siroheme synthase (precorrin-2 oxidase/ferrochelatase)
MQRRDLLELVERQLLVLVRVVLVHRPLGNLKKLVIIDRCADDALEDAVELLCRHKAVAVDVVDAKRHCTVTTAATQGTHFIFSDRSALLLNVDMT